MDTTERSKRIANALQTLIDILDGEAQLHVLPSGTQDRTKALRQAFKCEVVQALAAIYSKNKGSK